MFLIGISGVAGSGKDTFASLLKPKLESLGHQVIIESFAARLRAEMADTLKDKFGLDVYTKDRAEKSKFRNLMVEWADIHRKESNGTYFINHLSHKLSFLPSKTIVLIPDTRFKEYEYDEVDWVKDNGVLVHLTKFRKDKIFGLNLVDEPANEFERVNDKSVKLLASFKVEWPDTRFEPYLSYDLNSHVDSFFDYLIIREKFKTFTSSIY